MSLLAMRFEASIPQAFDYTCGAASLATVLTYYWSRPTSEGDVVEALQHRYTLAEIARRRETGLSFDDLIFAANELGFQAQGAAIAVAELGKLSGPVIAQLNSGKFQHFVVLRTVGDEAYYISDPIVGSRVLGERDFRDEFRGYVLAVWRPGTPLPTETPLMRPKDGLSVHNSLKDMINASAWPPHPAL